MEAKTTRAFSLTKEASTKLDRLAKAQNRSPSNMVETLILEAEA